MPTRCPFPTVVAVILIALLAAIGCNDPASTADAGEDCDGPTCSGADDGGTEPADTDRTRDLASVDASDDPWVDDDGDGLFNGEDNCPGVPNPDQKDRDRDGVGDVCDNCPKVANREQTDSDGMAPGDACDEPGEVFDATRDADDDGHPDIDDNCPDTANPDQKNSDSDAMGDACDNCPQVPNPTQASADGMAPGDACAPEPAGPVCRRFKSDFEQFSPNLYFLLDKSGSMQGAKMNDAKRALVHIAQNFQSNARFGLTAFSDNCRPEELLAMGSHSASGVQSSFDRIRPAGKTGTGGALAIVRSETRFLEVGEDPSVERPRAIFLITDGNANVCGGLGKAKSEAEALRDDHDVETHVIGFKSDADPSKLEALAKSGGTGSHLTADDFGELKKAIEKVYAKVIPCEFDLPEPSEGIDPRKIWVKIEGDFAARDAYSFDAQSNTLTLDSAACGRLQQASGDPLTDPIEIVLGCPDACNSDDTEVCDYRDNDCDGQIDEGCEGCRPEVCDGADTDCDGATDEGCPMCALGGQECRADGECCWGVCKEGRCRTGCRPIGVPCSSNADCCSDSCGKSGGSEQGTCIGR